MTAEEELEDMEEDEEEVEMYETETDETETTETESDEEDDSKKSPVGKNTFSILIQVYSKCKPLMWKVHVIHCFSTSRIEILWHWDLIAFYLL